MARKRIHAERVPSDKDPSKSYQVYLFDDGATCECADFFNRNVVAGNPKHECKHILDVRWHYQPTPTFLHSVPFNDVKNVQGGRRIDVYEDEAGRLYLRALNPNGLYEQPATMSEDEIRVALEAGRQTQRNRGYVPSRWGR